jgi:DNA-directed RNA polymerase subunit RPC12/RpoP
MLCHRDITAASREVNVMEYCSLCKKELKNGTPAVGITSGVISEECEGFAMDLDTPWDVVACWECGEKIMNRIFSNQ